MHNLYQNFNKILDIVKQSLGHPINTSRNIEKSGRKPKFSNAEVTALSIIYSRISDD